jgi:mannose-1-phosphate guanylyltransferase/phosphomannomutase
MTQPMHAVIMAGGEGSRLRPLTNNMPKPMLPVANRPLMEHIIGLLTRHGFTEVTATVQFLASVISNYFGDGTDAGISLTYSVEEEPLGTAGSVLNAREFLPGTFLVISGDALTDVNLEEVVAFHRAKGAAATLVLKRMADPLEFGIVMTDSGGHVERFLEKPSWGQVFSDTINTGIYVLEPEVLDLIPPGQPYDFSSELFPLVLDKGLPLFGFVTDAYWTDVGNTDSFLQAQKDALSGHLAIDIPGFEFRPRVWVGEGVEVDPTARVEGPTVIGDYTRVGAGAIVGPHAVVGDNVLVRDDARIVGGVVMDMAHVGPLAQVRGGVLGRQANLGRGAAIEEGSVLGDEVTVGPGALIKTGVKVYPSRVVEAGAIVTQSVIHEQRATRGLFGSRGVSGLVNVGLTPVVAVRLGMAYGSTLKRGSTVITGRDASRAARTMKRAVIAGLNAAGVNCHDLELTPASLTRFTVRSRQASGGVSVQTSSDNPEVVEIRLFDPDGGDLSEGGQRRIERVFFREEYRRPGPRGLGELEFPAHAPEQYVSGVLRAVDIDAVRRAEFKVVVDYAFGPVSMVGPSIMGRLGCDLLAVNAYTDEHRPALSPEDLAGLVQRLREHVRNSGSDLGILIEPGGEVAHLVDDRGRAVGDGRALLAFLSHEVSRGAGDVAVPGAASSECGRIAEAAGARLRWTPTSLTSLMAVASEPGVGFAGNASGTLLWPDFMPAPDGVMTFCKALEMVAIAERPLSELVDGLPDVHIAARDVPTPWHLKGAVMRRMPELAGDGRLVLIDGVKVDYGDSWALVVPYPDEPMCRVWAEAPTVAGAAELAERFTAMVGRVVSEGVDE